LGSNLCQTTDSVKVNVIPTAVFSISPNTSTCFNNPKQINANGGDLYTWVPSTGLSDSTISNPIATLQNTTSYSVKITSSACNDTATLNTTISILPNPTVTAISANNIDCTTGQSQLTATGALQYSWLPATGLSNPTIYNPIASPTASTTYTVTGKDQNGCTDSSFVTVDVTQNGKSGYYIPNAFTPNGDGLNDCFGIKNWGQIQFLEFAIFNRYGQKVFYTENPSGCWDGTFNGQQQPSGNYIYYIKATTVCGSVDKKGTVLLIK
jgi:gliding motility-associated-like protein